MTKKRQKRSKESLVLLKRIVQQALKETLEEEGQPSRNLTEEDLSTKIKPKGFSSNF